MISVEIEENFAQQTNKKNLTNIGQHLCELVQRRGDVTGLDKNASENCQSLSSKGTPSKWSSRLIEL